MPFLLENGDIVKVLVAVAEQRIHLEEQRQILREVC